jgi:ADP-L-glycero-D-manno-heptose 6-epimerase
MIVVTGAAGFIGSNLLAGLEARGASDLVACDRLGTGDKWRNIAKRELAAIVAPESLLDFLARNRYAVETVFHLGAISSTTEIDADLVVEQNFRYSLALWEWCAEAGVPFIYASSAATYGDGAQGFDDDGAPGSLARLRPLNAYGWSKHLFDRRVARLAAGNASRPPHWAGLKFFNVYGPNEYHKGGQRSVVPQIYEQIAGSGRARLFKSHRPDYPDGGQKRDFVWVGDCVEVLLWLADNRPVNGLFNCGTGTARTFLDLANAVIAESGQTASVEFVPTPENIRDKYQYFTEARMERLRAAGYAKPFTTLEEGVALYVRNHLRAADPYL